MRPALPQPARLSKPCMERKRPVRRQAADRSRNGDLWAGSLELKTSTFAAPCTTCVGARWWRMRRRAFGALPATPLTAAPWPHFGAEGAPAGQGLDPHRCRCRLFCSRTGVLSRRRPAQGGSHLARGGVLDSAQPPVSALDHWPEFARGCRAGARPSPSQSPLRRIRRPLGLHLRQPLRPSEYR